MICAPGLAMAERSRSPRREKYLWVKVKGGVRPIKINFAELHDVDDLLQTVKKEEKQKLGSVDSGDLQLFQSEEAKDGGSEALRPDLRVAEIAGGEEMTKPLYVSFPDAEVATASQAPAKQIWTCIVCFIVFNLFSFQQQRMMKQVQSASHGSLFALCFPFCLSERKTDRDKRERERDEREILDFVPSLLLSSCHLSPAVSCSFVSSPCSFACPFLLLLLLLLLFVIFILL